MSKPTQKQVREIVAKWQELLNLQHWTIDCVFTGSDENVAAECLFPKSGVRMTFEFNLDCADFSELDGTKEMIVVHEFVHVLIRPVIRSTKKLNNYSYGTDGDIGASFSMELHQHEEDLCDHLAKVLIGLHHSPAP